MQNKTETNKKTEKQTTTKTEKNKVLFFGMYLNECTRRPAAQNAPKGTLNEPTRRPAAQKKYLDA